MIDETQQALIHRVLDGDVTPEEQATFETLLAERADVRRLYQDLQATTALLAGVATAVPPPDLKRRIMQALPADRYAARPAPPRRRLAAGIVQALREAFAARPALAYAYAMTVGVLIGVAAYALLDAAGRGPEAADAYGTMAATSAVTRTYAVDVQEAPGSVRVTQGDDRLVVELELAPQAATEAHLTFDPATLHWQGVARVDEGTAAGLATSDGAVRLAFAGPAHYRVTFDRARSPALTLVLLQGERELYRQRLTVPAGEDE